MQLPARYDHVGSFLRPRYLLEAREEKARGDINAEQLRAVEDKAITEIVKFQGAIRTRVVSIGRSPGSVVTSAASIQEPP